MAKTVTITGPTPGGVIANQTASFVVTVANTDAAAATLTALVTRLGDRSAAGRVGQPTFMPAGQPASVYPVIGASSSASYQFGALAYAPNMPGVSPNNPGGAAPSNNAIPNAPPLLVVQAEAQFSDGSVASTSLTVPVLSAVAPFPVPQGGAAQFGQGANSNLIAAFA